MDKQHPQQQWQQAVTAYAQAINHYVAQGRAQGWDDLEEPQVPATDHLLDAWQASLQAINRAGVDEQQRQAVRKAWRCCSSTPARLMACSDACQASSR